MRVLLIILLAVAVLAGAAATAIGFEWWEADYWNGWLALAVTLLAVTQLVPLLASLNRRHRQP